MTRAPENPLRFFNRYKDCSLEIQTKLGYFAQDNHILIGLFFSWTMRNLSDVATGIVDAGPLAVELVNLLRHSEEPVVICAAGILSNLTGTY